MPYIDDYLKDLDISDNVVKEAREKLLKIAADPLYRRKCVGEAEKRINELSEMDWEDQSEEFTISLRGVDLMRLRVLMVFFTEILGVPEEDVLRYLVTPGIEQETYKLGLVRQAIGESLGYPTPKIEDLSIDAEDLLNE